MRLPTKLIGFVATLVTPTGKAAQAIRAILILKQLKEKWDRYNAERELNRIRTEGRDGL